MNPLIPREARPGPHATQDAPQLVAGQERPGQGLPLVQLLLGVILVVFFLLTTGCPRLPDTMTWENALLSAGPTASGRAAVPAK
jgi:hypothetical protein